MSNQDATAKEMLKEIEDELRREGHLPPEDDEWPPDPPRREVVLEPGRRHAIFEDGKLAVWHIDAEGFVELLYFQHEGLTDEQVAKKVLTYLVFS